MPGLAGSPTLSPDGAAVYVVASGANVLPSSSMVWKFSAVNGSKVWGSVLSTSDKDAYVGVLARPQGDVIFFNSDSHLHCVSAATGVQVFDVTLPIGAKIAGVNKQTVMTPCLLPSGGAAFGNTGGISAVAPTSGATAWTFATSGGVSAVPIVDSNGFLFFGDATGKVYCLSATGALQWSVLLPAKTIWASGVIDSKGMLYVATSSPPAIFALQSLPSGFAVPSSQPPPVVLTTATASATPGSDGVSHSPTASATPSASAQALAGLAQPAAAAGGSGFVSSAVAIGAGVAGGLVAIVAALAAFRAGRRSGGGAGRREIFEAKAWGDGKGAAAAGGAGGGAGGGTGGGGAGAGDPVVMNGAHALRSEATRAALAPAGAATAGGWTECYDSASGQRWFHQAGTYTRRCVQ